LVKNKHFQDQVCPIIGVHVKKITQTPCCPYEQNLSMSSLQTPAGTPASLMLISKNR